MAGSSSLSGADVGHLTPGLKMRPSVASLTWSYDRLVVRYEAMMSIQHPCQEKIDELRKLIYVGSLLSTACTRHLTITSRLSTSLAIITKHVRFSARKRCVASLLICHSLLIMESNHFVQE
jgi:hypothetical protein